MGADMWRHLVFAQTSVLGHLHEIPLTLDAMQSYAIQAALAVASCAAPVVIATAIGGLLAGGIQNRFQTASEALTVNWEKLNPVEGFKRVFSTRSVVAT